MGNTSGQTRVEVLDAVAGEVTHGPARAVHRRLSARGLRPRRAGPRRYGISRKTAHKWIDRYDEAGPAGLVDRSRRPICIRRSRRPPSGGRGPAGRCGQHHPTWGAKKLLKVVATQQPTWLLPARSAVCDLLDRAGLIPTSRRRTVPGASWPASIPMTAPNGTWTADFKGQFKTRNGVCTAIRWTVVDGFSRVSPNLLACQGLLSTAERIAGARPTFLRLFREYGLPEDHPDRQRRALPRRPRSAGSPRCPSGGFGRGSRPELIELASPQQNGRHERMHRDPQGRSRAPAESANLEAQQIRFNPGFVASHQRRPAERALNQETPASRYRPSARELPGRGSRPSNIRVTLKVRLVESQQRHPLEEALGLRHAPPHAGESVGLEEVGDGLWDVCFGPLKLGRLDERRRQIEDHKGRFSRKTMSPMSPD